ncbi:hypothetical protein PA598K_04325 [Paenibacillus sp. 598K]|uniref:phosphotransferase n=1 Tax=Paenibacillus sp. 598K TaxID=1117987 RepID=UPI000FF9158A|nr:phosphotransferase [Paenibacillus sp. 598K]GBF75891.1 hypothetical protein PA598K_04325 [Paenibacillus sp. 598K]
MSTLIEPDLPAFLDQYDWPEPWQAYTAESGMNNTTRMVACGENRYVLRIYDNHKDRDKVLLEHAVLAALGEDALPGLRVPCPVRNREGGTVTIGPLDKLAALYRYIPGERAVSSRPAHVAGLGRATGRLARALERIELPLQPIYPPYYRLEDDYQAFDAARLRSLAERDGTLRPLLPELEQLQRERHLLSQRQPELERLPIQWIHGDLVFNNTLAVGDEVIAILDFEYCTRDLRAMELAVVLAEFVGPDSERSLQQIGCFVDGYRQEVLLLQGEQAMLPSLIKLRMLDVWLHFAHRYEERLDGPEVWRGQILRASEVCDWVNRHEVRLLELLG